MERIAIFASFDAHGIIHDYVISYLKRLKKVANKIIFIMDNKVEDLERQKISHLIDYAEFVPHGEYDFGSYKRGYNYAIKNGWLENADEIIFCNDSCFCIRSFEDIFNEMARKECDFWGITESKMHNYHLQSYFLTFKKSVFLSADFNQWINNIEKQNNVKEIVRQYELALTPFLQHLNFKPECLIKTIDNKNPTTRPLCLLNQSSPLIKRKVFILQEARAESPYKLLKFLKINYPCAYSEICNYHKNIFHLFFLLMFPKDTNRIRRFIYQKKVTKSGKTRIKILRIPVPIQLFKKIGKFVYSTKQISPREKKVRILCFTFKRKELISAEERIETLEKNIIAQSPFWDALWYIKKYNHQMNRYEALDYWYSKGWKKGESPSKYINLDYCRGAFDEVNPIICYMSKDEKRGFFPDDKNNYKTDNDFERISQYLDYKNTRKAKSVVYTCITNGYDNIYELEAYGYINPEWDYVCFTDNQDEIKAQRIGIWEMRPLQFDKSDVSRINRWHKMHPHILFPEYEESIYIDSNINILTYFLFKEIKRLNQPFVLPRHFKNMCIYSEYNDVLQAKLDTAERINQARDFMKKQGMPQNYGFCENNVLYRQHHNTQIIAIMEEWWNLLEKYAKRDQLYLTYLFWKNNIRIEDITFENTRLLINDFYVFGHQKKGKKK